MFWRGASLHSSLCFVSSHNLPHSLEMEVCALTVFLIQILLPPIAAAFSTICLPCDIMACLLWLGTGGCFCKCVDCPTVRCNASLACALSATCCTEADKVRRWVQCDGTSRAANTILRAVSGNYDLEWLVFELQLQLREVLRRM